MSAFPPASSYVSDPYEVKSTKGTLITCDSAAKQILLHLDSMREGPRKFVLRDVDESHVLIHTPFVEEVREALQEELEKNTYVQDTAAC